MAEICPALREALLGEDWQLFLKQTVLYAQCRINQLRWRGGFNGPLPDGYDAEGVAAEAIIQILDGNSRIRSAPYDRLQLQNELKRLVSNHVHSLNRRKETRICQNESDLAIQDEDGEATSFFDSLPGNSLSADAEALRKEARAKLLKFEDEFTTFLGNEQILKSIFECISANILKRDEIAELLEITPKQVTNARRRLDRRLADFALQHPDYPKAFIQEMINV